MFQRPLTVAGGVPQGKKPTALFQMTLNEFKQALGVENLPMVAAKNGSHYAWTGMGLLFTDKTYNRKSKVQTVTQSGFTDDGYVKFTLSNRPEVLF